MGGSSIYIADDELLTQVLSKRKKGERGGAHLGSLLSRTEGALLRASAHAVVAKGRGGCAGVVAELKAFLGPGPRGAGVET